MMSVWQASNNSRACTSCCSNKGRFQFVVWETGTAERESVYMHKFFGGNTSKIETIRNPHVYVSCLVSSQMLVLEKEKKIKAMILCITSLNFAP